MIDWKKTLVSPSISILKVIEIIDSSRAQIALVIDENNNLLGTVTDGDIRRGILKGVSLNDCIQRVMNPNPTVVKVNEGRGKILATMRSKRLQQLPIVDEAGRVVGMEVLQELMQPGTKENLVVLMAGGRGSRLLPMTNHCPKPLLKVGGKPLLKIIMDNFIEFGFKKFYLSVNYKAEMVKEFCGDGSDWGVKIEYIEEDKKMGTAGALGLLPEKPTLPVLVMNSDLLTKINFNQLLEFHNNTGANATMCVKEYDLQIPYGVININNQRVIGIEEKPFFKCFINAGIYVLGSDVFDHIPKNTFFDMTNLFEKLIGKGSEIAVFPIREYWIDIGRIDDFERANGDFYEVFE